MAAKEWELTQKEQQLWWRQQEYLDSADKFWKWKWEFEESEKEFIERKEAFETGVKQEEKRIWDMKSELEVEMNEIENKQRLVELETEKLNMELSDKMKRLEQDESALWE